MSESVLSWLEVSGLLGNSEGNLSSLELGKGSSLGLSELGFEIKWLSAALFVLLLGSISSLFIGDGKDTGNSLSDGL